MQKDHGGGRPMMGGNFGDRRAGGGRVDRHGGPGSVISLERVGQYTIIAAFVVMLTCLLDQWYRNFSRLRKTC
jgi:hypothetical protein